MMRYLLSGVVVVLALCFDYAYAADPPDLPIRAFDIPTIEKLGAALYYQDTAAWRATDALLLKVPDPNADKVVGWIVVGEGKASRVRFLRDTGSGLEAGYDINDPFADKPTVTTPTDRTLTAEERAAFAARQTAAANMGAMVCRPGYNSVVLHDVEGDGWLVWLLAPSPAAGVIPIGGHYRFSISADGKTMIRRDALSKSCLTMNPASNAPAGGKPVAAIATHLVSPTPIETHVFLQMEYRTPLIIAAGGKVWGIDGGHIKLEGDIPSAAK